MKDCKDYSFPHHIALQGKVANYVDLLLNKWTKEGIPYSAFEDNFRKGRINNFAGGETWGKAVRCACLYYRYKQDPVLLEMIRHTVRAVIDCERHNGSISCATVENQPDSAGGDLWERKYVLLGLAHYLRDVEFDAEVLASMVRQVDCLIEQIGPAPKTPITKTGWSPNKLESSTVLLPVMLVYQRTGESRHLAFAKYIVEQGGCDGYDLLEEAIRRVPPHEMAGGIYPKAYEMMSFFIGVIEYHLATGDTRCRQAALALYETICMEEITLLGSGGGDAPYHQHGECWDHTAYEQTNSNLNRTMETCVAATWLQYCVAIHRLTEESHCIDQIERTFFNALIGAAKPTGVKFSYMNRLNGVKCDPNGWGVWIPGSGTITCCDLNGPMGLVSALQMAATRSADGVCVNLFLPGDVQLRLVSGNTVDISIDTEFPLEGIVRVRVSSAQPETFVLRIRIPDWSTNPSVTIGGETVEATCGTYTELRREWGSGSEVMLDLGLTVKSRLSAKDNRIAIERGPIVFARDENMDLQFDTPVQLEPRSGIIDARIEKPFYDTVWQQLQIPTPGGGSFRMVDWASINNWNDRRTCTWLPLSAGETMRQENKMNTPHE